MDELKPGATNYRCALCGLTRARAIERGLAVNFHKFPTNASLRQDWERFCGSVGRRQTNRWICSGHFTKDCYNGDFPTRMRRPLVKGSVPTIRNPWGTEELPEPESEPEPEPAQNIIAPVRLSCFLCRQKNRHHVPLIGGVQPTPSEPMSSGEWQTYRGSVIAKYFAFELRDMANEVVCLQCWLKVEEFHQFHGQIEAAHAQEAVIPFAHVQVKQEALAGLDEEVVKAEQLESAIKVKTEQITDHDASDSQKRELKVEPEGGDDQNEAETWFLDHLYDSSDHESNEKEETIQEPPPKKRSKNKNRPISALQKSDQLIAQNCVIICHLCSQTFEKFFLLQVHCREVHQAKGRITCCNKDFTERARLMEHLHSHDNPDLLRCIVCGVLLSCIGNLRRHQIQSHTVFTGTPVNAMTCEKCSKVFTDRAVYNVHLKIHLALETKQYQCKECNKAFGNSFMLKQHVVRRHTHSFDYVCEVCAKGFLTLKELDAHTQEHDPDVTKARVECPDCNRFYSKQSIRKHRRMMHTANEPVSCEICGKQAPNRVALASHRRFVHRQGKFGCTVCGKTFAKAISLREHMTTHNDGGEGGSLYVCPHCPKTFNSNANMHSHRKKMHFEEWLQGRAQRQGVE